MDAVIHPNTNRAWRGTTSLSDQHSYHFAKQLPVTNVIHAVASIFCGQYQCDPTFSADFDLFLRGIMELHLPDPLLVMFSFCASCALGEVLIVQ